MHFVMKPKLYTYSVNGCHVPLLLQMVSSRAFPEELPGNHSIFHGANS